MTALTVDDTILPWPAQAYHGTFSPDDPPIDVDGALPPGRHALYFHPDVPLAALRPDGTPAHDGIVPDVDLPRRMFAAEEITFHRPIRFGERLRQRTSLGGLTEKRGGSGRLVFARILQEIGDAVSVVQDDVFLDVPSPDEGAATGAPDTTRWDWEQPLRLGATQLFRFSALTFNSHRIHLDPAYAREVEGYPDMLVHGPLLRLLLIDAAVRWTPSRRAHRFSLRLLAPTYVDEPIRIVGRPTADGTELAALGADGTARVRGTMTWVNG